VTILLGFERDFPEAKVIKLEQNYRSTQKILDAAHAVVERNPSRKAKKLWTERGGGEPLRFYSGGDGRDEGRYIAREIKDQLPKRSGYKDFVILYRTNAQSRLLEEAMISASIPYKIIGGLRFFERKEIKDVLGYLQVLINPADGLAVRRILNVPPRGVGATTLEKLFQAATEREWPLWQAVGEAGRFEVTGKAKLALQDLVDWMDSLRAKVPQMKVTDILQEVFEKSGYRKWLDEDNKVEAQVRQENLDELVNVTSEYDRNAGEEASLEGFLAEVSLLSDQDTYAEDAQAVTLMTLHAAKGLEFPVVFLAGLEEDTFPHSRSRDDAAQLEEERRLCYVGLTRAKDMLYLTSAQTRDLHGQRRYCQISRFVDEIPRQLLLPESVTFRAPARAAVTEAPSIGSGQWKGWGQQQPAAKKSPSTFASPSAKARFAVGQKVTHASFGEGLVEAVDVDVVTVAFEKSTRKLKQDFLKPVGGGGEAPLKIGDRLVHPRFGNGTVKVVDFKGVMVVFAGMTLVLPAEEAARLPRP
jgi:DNA helicase-2/ATP-dependent DNA helicase PcrA